MKRALLLISALISISSAASAAEEVKEMPKSVDLRCETPWPTASAVARTENAVVRLDLTFHYGSGRIPISLDSVSADDLPTIQSTLELARQIDKEVRLEWALDRCVVQASGLYRCYSGEQIPLPGSSSLKIENAVFFTSRVSNDQVHGSRTRYIVEVWLTIGGSVLRVALPYDEKDCSLTRPQTEQPHQQPSLRHPM